jgi:membrane protein DedA with SNARE-associated domain
MVEELLGGLPPIVVYLVVGTLVTLETALLAGLVLPSATALIAMGLLANAGVVPFLPALAVAVGSAILGGNLAYRRGAFAGLGRHAERTEKLFARFGGRAIFLGQWVVGARTLMPRLAARNHVPLKRFLAWHTPAASLWAAWMVGASYAAGASYDVLAARAGRATGALAALTVLILGLVLAGRWLGQNPGIVRAIAAPLRNLRPFRGLRDANPSPFVSAALSFGFLVIMAVLLVALVPAVVRFSGLAATDDAIAEWMRNQWTSDGYLFALDTAMSVSPAVLIAVAVLVALVRALIRDRSWRVVPQALGPVLPAMILAAVLATAMVPGWRAVDQVRFPAPDEFDGLLPLNAPAMALATMSAGQTAQVAAASGLLAWLVAGGLPWRWRVTVWTAAAMLVTLCAGAWIYLGWSRMSETVAAVALGAAWAALNAAIWSGSAGTPARASRRTAPVERQPVPMHAVARPSWSHAEEIDGPDLTRSGL